MPRGYCGKVHVAVSMLFPPVDPNERFRERRAAARRRKRLRRGSVVSAVLAGVALLSVGAQFVSTSGSPSEAIETQVCAVVSDGEECGTLLGPDAVAEGDDGGQNDGDTPVGEEPAEDETAESDQPAGVGG